MANTKEELYARLMAMSKEEIIKQTTKQVKAYQEKLSLAAQDIAQKDRLIAEMSSVREQTDMERDRILQAANKEAREIIAEARHIAEEANSISKQKMETADIQAAAIVESKLQEYKEQIDQYQQQRDAIKQSNITFLRNIAKELASIAEHINETHSGIHDMQDFALDAAEIIEKEEFGIFNLTDFTMPTKATLPAFESSATVFDAVDAVFENDNKEARLRRQDLLENDDIDIRLLENIVNDEIDDSIVITPIVPTNDTPVIENVRPQAPASAPAEQVVRPRENAQTDPNPQFAVPVGTVITQPDVSESTSNDTDFESGFSDDDLSALQAALSDSVGVPNVDDATHYGSYYSNEPQSVYNVENNDDFDEDRTQSFTESFMAVENYADMMNQNTDEPNYVDDEYYQEDEMVVEDDVNDNDEGSDSTLVIPEKTVDTVANRRARWL